MTVAPDGRKAIERFRADDPDLVILDLMLPEVSGLDVCRMIRAESTVPIVMVTAKDSEADKVAGLELGADDYVTKPFSVRELVSRVRAHLRRARMQGPAGPRRSSWAAGSRWMSAATRSGSSRELVPFPPKEFELLEAFLRRKGRLLTRDHLIEEIWGYDYVGDTKTLDVHVKRIRQKIEDDPHEPELPADRPRARLQVRGLSRGAGDRASGRREPSDLAEPDPFVEAEHGRLVRIGQEEGPSRAGGPGLRHDPSGDRARGAAPARLGDRGDVVHVAGPLEQHERAERHHPPGAVAHPEPALAAGREEVAFDPEQLPDRGLGFDAEHVERRDHRVPELLAGRELLHGRPRRGGGGIRRGRQVQDGVPPDPVSAGRQLREQRRVDLVMEGDDVLDLDADGRERRQQLPFEAPRGRPGPDGPGARSSYPRSAATGHR